MNKKLIETEDGSFSFYNSDFDEAYHSKAGAYSEALHKHVLACKIPEMAKAISLHNANRSIKILDLCFGLGYNSFVAVDQAWKISQGVKLEIIGLENDPEIIAAIKDLDWNCLSSEELKLQISAFAENCKEISTPNLKLKIHYGDACETVKDLENDFFDAVFFDPFSPKKCPQLWQPAFVTEIVSKAKRGAWISTYSSSRIAKESFQAAGCDLFEGPKLNRRTGGVLACRM